MMRFEYEKSIKKIKNNELRYSCKTLDNDKRNTFIHFLS